MSRRESRVSMSERRNDALFEFENCMCLPSFRTSHVSSHSPPHFTVKKKFLLANKHITKSVHATLRTLHPLNPPPPRLNATLSVRIEELNAQISALHVENLRLRASEIALGLQLKKEKEKSERIVTDAESAVSLHFHLLSSSHFSRKARSCPCLTCKLLIGSTTGYPVPDTEHETAGADLSCCLIAGQLSYVSPIPLSAVRYSG
jgi:hypothetical protein